MAKRTWTDDQLRAAVSSSTSWMEVMRTLDLSPRGRNHINVTRRARILALDTSHFAYLLRGSSDEKLRAVVAASANYDEVFDLVDARFDPAGQDKIRRRLSVLGIDTAHLEPTTKSRTSSPRPRRWTDDQLREAVLISRSYRQAIRNLGLVPIGGNYQTVQRRVAILGLDVGHFTRKGWRRGAILPPKPAVPIEDVLVENRPTGSNDLKHRLFRLGLKKPECERCGWAERAPDGRLPLELDHINGKHDDNRLVNLQILCPNCHSLQPTHRGRNQTGYRNREK